MKRTISILLVLLMVLSFAPITFAEDEAGGGESVSDTGTEDTEEDDEKDDGKDDANERNVRGHDCSSPRSLPHHNSIRDFFRQ